MLKFQLYWSKDVVLVTIFRAFVDSYELELQLTHGRKFLIVFR